MNEVDFIDEILISCHRIRERRMGLAVSEGNIHCDRASREQLRPCESN